MIWKARFLYEELSRHFSENRGISVETAGVLKRLLREGWYEDIIVKLPEDELTHRGMMMTRRGLANLIHVSEDEIGDSGSHDVPFLYTPRRGGSSWSAGPGADTSYAHKGGVNTYVTDDYDYAVIMEAFAADNPNTFLKCEPFSEIDGLDTWSLNGEVLALGSVNVINVTWTLRDKSQKFTNQPLTQWAT